MAGPGSISGSRTVSDRIAIILSALAGAWRLARCEGVRLVSLARARLPRARFARLDLGRIDIVGALIRLADGIEAGVLLLRNALHGMLPRRGLGLTGAFAWRGAAAMTGIGLSAALVSGLSATGGEATIASLTAADSAREVRRSAALGSALRPLAEGAESWVRIARPIAMFGLEAPELGREPDLYEARHSRDGSQREDVLVFGAFSAEKPHLLLRLHVAPAENELSQPFMIALVREAAARGLAVQRSNAPTGIGTRFGPVETADALLHDGAAARSCIAFRMGAGDVPLAMSGWWCGGERPADRRQLTCLIDRIALLNAGENRALRVAFARTELARQPGCAPPRLSASGRKASWLDGDGRVPPLKTAARR